MERNMEASLDNIHNEFYQICLEIIKDGIIQVVDDTHGGCFLVDRLNYGGITLLPKATNARKI